MLGRKMCLAALVLLMSLFVGCGKREARTSKTAADSTSSQMVKDQAIRDQTGRVIRTSEQREGTPIGRTDPDMNAAAPALAPWVAMWRIAMPGFKPDSLYRAGTSPAFRGLVQPLKGVYPPPPEREPTFQILSARSPDGRYDLIFDWYQVIVGNSGDVDIGDDADSAPLLLDLRNGTSNMFDFYGPDGHFQWGVWLSPSRFALGGSRYEHPFGTRGWIKLYSLEDSTATMYVTRQLSTAEGTKYRSAWEEWVTSRYRALKRGKQPS